MASHIVGGEFEIIHVVGNTYRINLILYFDELNGSPGARDTEVNARIYRKRDNVPIRNVLLPFSTQTAVNYTQPECSHGEIVTSKLIYTSTVIFSEDTYSDPDGYYIVWERCCRNYTITNVISNDPLFGVFAGQTFYLEFPPVVKNGQPFVDSSPRLFPPLNDYACPNRPYYVDFAGSDDDGDSLVYSLVEPLNTYTGEPVPAAGPHPRPYPVVTWRPPYSFDNILNGNPQLKISNDGFITVTPTTQGLFVFAVKCEEFRNGEKIGEVRRDFQMLVVDHCADADPPHIMGKKLSDADFTYNKTMNVSFTNAVADEDRCIQVQVSDPDASKSTENFQELIKIKAIPLGFKKDVSGILPGQVTATLINGSTKTFEICFPECPYQNGPYTVGIVAMDDACSLPLTDTLKVTVNVQPPPNVPARFTTPDVTATLAEGDKMSWNIQAVDDDGDQVVMGFIPVGFDPALAGFTFTQSPQAGGTINAQLEWDANCSVYDFTHKTDFEVWIVAEDIDHCNINNPDVMKFNLSLLLPGNHPPIIDTDRTSDPFERTLQITQQIYDRLQFNVYANDIDNDFLVMGMQGVGFNPADIGVSFQPVSGNGSVQSEFTWDIPCEKINLKVKNTYAFEFLVVDNVNKCHFQNADTLDVIVTLMPPNNREPTLIVNSLNADQALENGSMATMIGDQINLGLYGSDPDVIPEPDYLHIDLIDARGTVPPDGYVFEPAEGAGNIETTFSWNPECSIFQNGVKQNDYKFMFRVYDNRCNNSMADTVEVNIDISDVESDETAFMPPNIITPNGDDCNDYFAMEGADPSESCPTVQSSNLPADNCDRHFESIHIFNRWGKQVFESTDRNFRWYANGEPSGIYFYLLKYSDKEYKGNITVRY